MVAFKTPYNGGKHPQNLWNAPPVQKMSIASLNFPVDGFPQWLSRVLMLRDKKKGSPQASFSHPRCQECKIYKMQPRAKFGVKDQNPTRDNIAIFCCPNILIIQLQSWHTYLNNILTNILCIIRHVKMNMGHAPFYKTSL